MKSKSDIKSAADRIRSLKNKILANTHVRCFWNLCDLLIGEQDVSWDFTDLVKSFDASSMTLALPSGNKDLKIEIKELFKLNCGPFKFKYNLIERDGSYERSLFKYVKNKYNLDLASYKNQSNTISTLWGELSEQEPVDVMSDARFAIRFTLALVSTVIAPKHSHRVNLDILGDLIPVERINILDWDDFILERLADGAGDGRGCLYLLDVAKVRAEQANGIDSPPQGSPSDDDMTGDARSGGTDNESLNSSVKNDVDILVEELNWRYGFLRPFMDQEPLDLDAEGGSNASGEESEERPFMDEEPLEPDAERDQGNAAFQDQGHAPVGADQSNTGAGRGDDQAARQNQPPLGENQAGEGARHGAGQGDVDQQPLLQKNKKVKAKEKQPSQQDNKTVKLKKKLSTGLGKDETKILSGKREKKVPRRLLSPLTHEQAILIEKRTAN